MNSSLASRQGFFSRFLIRIRGLERAKLCEVLDGLVEPHNSSDAFSTVSGEPAPCPNRFLPIDPSDNHLESADGPRPSLDAYAALEESFSPCGIDVFPAPNSGDPANALDSADSWEDLCSKRPYWSF